MLTRGEPAGDGKTVAATWTLAFDQLEQSAPGAAGLLRYSLVGQPADGLVSV